MVDIKRVYEPPSPADGERILVDRLWPRGVSRAAARLAGWARELAPSDALRRWFGHRPERWPEFRRRYRAELARRRSELEVLARRAARRRLTLVYGAADPRRNNAVVLREVLEELARARGRTGRRRRDDDRATQRAAGGRAGRRGDAVAAGRRRRGAGSARTVRAGA